MKSKKVIAIFILLLLIGAGTWYYFSRIQHAPIEKILSAPGAYEGKMVTIEGEVTDQTAFFVSFKFLKVRDKSGEIIVVTKNRTLPEMRSEVRIKGRVKEDFAIGDQKLVVLVAESVEEKGKKP